MSLTLRRTQPSDREAILDLFRESLQPTAGSPLLDPAVLEWKYWTPHPLWSGSRGFVMEKDGELAAHAAAWPVSLARGAAIVHGLHLIDWAARKGYPGAGVALLNRIVGETGCVFNIGGSEDTNAILPRLGFRNANDSHLSAKPLRPWRQAWTHQRRNLKLPLRLLRNFAWNLSGTVALPAGWEAAPVPDPGAAPPPWWEAAAGPGIRPLRTAEWYRYILASPAARFELFDLRRQGVSQGYFCLAHCSGQARLADYRLSGEPSPDAWTALAAATVQQAKRNPSSAEMTVWTSDRPLLAELERAGFRTLRTDAIRCNRTEFEAALGEPYLFTALDSDFAFLAGPGPDYVT
jgi:hypothetical protein